MKKIAYLLITILLSTNLYAQNSVPIPINEGGECGSLPEPGIRKYTLSERNYAKYSNNQTQYVFNVFVHYIDGTVNQSEQELKTLDMVGTLNLAYNDNGIFFKYAGYDNISNTETDPNTGITYDYNILTNNNIGYLYDNHANNTSINIFVCKHIKSTSSRISGTTWTLGGNNVTKKVIAIKFNGTDDYLPVLNNPYPTNDELKKQTLNHEVGHYFGLIHPHQRWKYDSNNQLVPVRDDYRGCDALEEALDNSQWNTLGDLVEDTNPDRVKMFYFYDYDPNTDRFTAHPNYTTNCTMYWNYYHPHTFCGTDIDQNLFDPPMHNIMAYYHHCRVGFSQGQKDRMRAYIVNHINGGFLTNQLNTVESLYEPYAYNTPVNVSSPEYTDQSQLEVGVPYYWTHLKHFGYKFQKGFDYDFYHWDWSSDVVQQQLVFTTNGFDADPSFNNHIQVYELFNPDIGNLGIKIIQLDANNIIPIESSRNPIPGPTVQATTIISSDPNTNNAEIRELNEQEANDPNLIDNLETGKVHRIIKHLDNGENDVKNVYKDN